MKIIYQLIEWECDGENDEFEVLYSNKDLRCVIHYLLTNVRVYLSRISKDAYMNAQFNLNQPYLNNIDTWNKILYPDFKIIKFELSSDVFNEDEKMNMPNLVNNNYDDFKIIKFELSSDVFNEDEKMNIPI